MIESKKRKSIKRKKLNLISEYFLVRRGIRDYKSGVLHPDENGQFSSPYIIREISACILNIQHEKEILSSINLLTQTEINSSKILIENDSKKINELMGTQKEFDDPGKAIFLNDNISKDLYESLQKYEFQALTSIQSNKVFSIHESITQAQIKKENCYIRLIKEVELTKLRCWQIYEIFKTRICAYWSGVLKEDSHSGIIPPLFNADIIMSEVAHLIDKIGIEED